MLEPEWKEGSEDIKGYLVEGDITDLHRDIVADMVATLSPTELAREITKLAAMTKMRNQREADTALLVAAYVEEMAPYPADVVQYVLKVSARENVFFPAWAELYESLEFWGRRRMLLADAILGEY